MKYVRRTPDATSLRNLGYGSAAVALAIAAFLLGGDSTSDGIYLGLAAIALALTTRLGGRIIKDRMRELAVERGRNDDLLREVSKGKAAVNLLADGLDSAILICDGRGLIQYYNLAANQLFRLGEHRSPGVLDATLSQELQHLVQDAASSGLPQRAEVAFRYPEERIGQVVTWRDPTDEERVVVSITDVTNLRKLERMRTDFVANVSHELRTPMTVIRSMAETMHDDPDLPLERRLRYLRRIIEEVDRLTMISNDLLILSAAESNPVRMTTCDLVEIVQNVVMQLEVKRDEKPVTFECRLPDSLPVAANPAQITQVVLNLLDNALKYTNEGTVTVTLSAQDNQAVLQVEDTGIGIGSEHLGRIFERFYRADKARSRETGGTGLGLSIVKHIVEAHGGELTVASELNRGSTFTVRLPVLAEPSRETEPSR